MHWACSTAHCADLENNTPTDQWDLGCFNCRLEVLLRSTTCPLELVSLGLEDFQKSKLTFAAVWSIKQQSLLVNSHTFKVTVTALASQLNAMATHWHHAAGNHWLTACHVHIHHNLSLHCNYKWPLTCHKRWTKRTLISYTVRPNKKETRKSSYVSTKM